MGERFPDHIRQFILQNVDSIETLEILLFLYERSEQGWTAADVSRELRGDAHSVRKRLSELSARGIISVDSQNPDMFSGGGRDERQLSLVRELSELYRTRRYSVIEIIFSRPVDVVRTFAEAFRVKKGDDNNG